MSIVGNLRVYRNGRIVLKPEDKSDSVPREEEGTVNSVMC